jgi:hypothetical protein
MFGSTATGVEFDFEDPVAQDSEQAAIDRDSRVLSVQTLVGLPGYKFDLEALLDAYDLPKVPFEEVDTPEELAAKAAAQTAGQNPRRAGGEGKGGESGASESNSAEQLARKDADRDGRYGEK